MRSKSEEVHMLLPRNGKGKRTRGIHWVSVVGADVVVAGRCQEGGEKMEYCSY